MSLTTAISTIDLASPVVAAAGCVGDGVELAAYTSLADFGAITTRSITLDAHEGQPMPRIAESPSGLVNAVGNPGLGVDGFLAHELSQWLAAGPEVIVSISAATVTDYGRVAAALRAEPIRAVEVNISSPVLAQGVLPFAADAHGAAAVVHAVRRNLGPETLLLAKLSGDVADLPSIAKACVGAGADGLTLINAVRAMAMNTQTDRPALGTSGGGLCGPAIHPISLRAVWDVHRTLPETPIVACGGIHDGQSALAMILAGACAVAVGSQLLHDPQAGRRIRSELTTLIEQRGGDLVPLIGAGHRGMEGVS